MAQSGAPVTVRNMSRDELDVAVEWARAEGWNPGLHDAGAFWAADPHGYFAAEAGGAMIGAMSAVAYDDRFGFIGLFIVRPDYRGRTAGVQLARHGLAYLGARTIGADGVMARLRVYGNQGFGLAYTNIRFEGTCRAGACDACPEVSAAPFSDLAAYDRTRFPAAREPFLRAWLAMPNARGVCALDGGRITGYGVIRRCHTGHKIGPLFADSADIAERMLASLTAPHAGDPFYLDVPEPNAAAMGIAARWGLREVFRTGRVYHTRAPSLDLDGIFGVTTFELG